MYNIKDKVVIVTGGANGIGAQIVREFVREGAKHVAIVDVDEASGVNLQNNLTIEYGRAVAGFLRCDITKDDELNSMFEEIDEKFGGIDVLVNNAGIATETMNTYKKQIEINFTATVSSTLKALMLMRTDRGGKGGTIINTSSVAALNLTSPCVFIYSAIKCAVLHLSVCMGNEEYYRHTNVRMLTVCFGATDTDMLVTVKGFDEIVNETMKKMLAFKNGNTTVQSANFAAQGVVQGYKTGKSGSTWLIDTNKVTDISEKIYQGFNIISSDVSKS